MRLVSHPAFQPSIAAQLCRTSTKTRLMQKPSDMSWSGSPRLWGLIFPLVDTLLDLWTCFYNMMSICQMWLWTFRKRPAPSAPVGRLSAPTCTGPLRLSPMGVWWATRALLGAPGIATSSKKLLVTRTLGAPGLTTRSMDATRGYPPNPTVWSRLRPSCYSSSPGSFRVRKGTSVLCQGSLKLNLTLPCLKGHLGIRCPPISSQSWHSPRDVFHVLVVWKTESIYNYIITRFHQASSS